ncbi:hypothetical protein KUF71_020432 [Frankliniella fusca]|uniref:RNA-directed DNA polymerase n=1 Tax=Frankliniella fusca TaxID=407009 RepID=A0AAE1GXI4_9NEOP|nr:hypothetical protein KUF71_020432 [Frankliniella fusca]
MAAQQPVGVLVGGIGELEHYDANGHTSFTQWVERFSIYCDVNGILPEPRDANGHFLQQSNRRRGLFLNMMGPRAYSIVHSACLPNSPSEFSIQNLVIILKSHFEPIGNVAVERYNFRHRMQRPEESVVEYINALQELASRCDYEGREFHRNLLEQLVAGVRLPEVRKAIMVANLTWANMKAIAIRTEGDIKHMAKLAQSYAQNQARSVHQVQPQKKPDVNNNFNKNKVKINPQQAGNSVKTESKVGNDQERKFNPCYRCGRRHNCKTCPAVNWECNFCKKIGHTSVVCRKKKKPEVKQVSVSNPPPEAGTEDIDQVVDELLDFDFSLCGVRPGEAAGPVSSFNVNLVQSPTSEPLIKKLLVNNIPLEMEIDTGSAVSLISLQDFQSKFPECSFSSSSTVLSVANKKPLKVLGELLVTVKCCGVEYKLPLLICDILEIPLLGRPWLDILVPKWREIFSLSVNSVKAVQNQIPTVESLAKIFPNTFDQNNDKPIKGFKATLVLKDNAIPVKHRAYKVPFAITDNVNQILDRMEAQGKAIRVRHATWASPSFPVSKKNGDYRLVVDFKKTINPQLRVDHYPIPSPEEIFSSLSKSVSFVSLDLKDAYMHISAVIQTTLLVLSRLEKHNVRLNLSKCEWFVDQIEFLGFILSKHGRQPNPGLTSAIHAASPPVNVSQLRSFLGLVNFYSIFIPQFSTMAKPLYSLLQSGQSFQWSQEAEAAFIQCKQAITCDKVLVNFDPSLPIVVYTDASPYGIGSVLCHSVPSYSYKLIHKKAEFLAAADALSRLPSPTLVQDLQVGAVKVATQLPVTADQVALETAKDPTLQVVLKFVHTGWPPKGEVVKVPEIDPYFKLRDNLSILGKCLMFSNRVIIPASLRSRVLSQIHEGHPGVVRSLMLARAYCWWPYMDQDIADMSANCTVCALVNFNPKKTFVPWPESTSPFERIHVDFYEKNSLTYFILCDSFSKWLHICHMPRTTASSVIDVLLSVFALFGLPKIIVSDNGPPFDSNDYAEFCTKFNVQILHSPPYSPASNGQAEKAVDIAKKGMEKIILSESHNHNSSNANVDLSVITTRLSKFLFNYRNTPTTTTKKTPNEILLLFKPRTMLTQLVPVSNKPSTAHFKEGDNVMFKLNARSPVLQGVIVEVRGPTRYLVSVSGVQREVHHNQLSRAP